MMASAVASGLAKSGVELEVVAPSMDGSDQFDSNQPYKVHRVLMIGSTFLSRLPSFYLSTRRLIKAFDGDLIYSFRPVHIRTDISHIHHFHATRLGLARGSILSGNYALAIPHLAYIPFDRYVSRNAKKTLVCSSKMIEEVNRSAGLPINISVVPNGVDLADWPYANRAFCSNKKQVLFVGRLDRLKGLNDLFSAILPLLMADERITLTLVGTGPLQGSIKSWQKSHGLESRVRLVPWLEQEKLAEIYRSHDLLVVPSKYEAFGLVILEGMLSGIPTLSSDACEALGQETYTTGDRAELTNRIESLINNPNTLADLSIRGREAAESFSSSNMLTLIHSEILKLAQQSGASLD